MNLNAPMGRPELSPDIDYKSGGHYKFGNQSYDKLKKKLRRQNYKNMSAEEKKEFNQKRMAKRQERLLAGENLSSDTDLSDDDDLSDIDPDEYREFILEKQQKRAEKGMLRAAGEAVNSDSDDSDYWKEAPGNVPRDMQHRSGFAQLLLPGPELIDISLPKDEVAKEKVLEMYANVLKDQLQGMTSLDDFDFDSDDDDDDFDEAEMELLLAKNGDIGDLLLNRGDLSPRTLKRREKKLKMYKKYKEIAEQMGPGTTIADVKKNVKRMLQKAKSNNMVFDEDGNLKPFEFTKNLVEHTAKSVMSGKFTGQDLVRDLTSAAEFFDKKMGKELKKKNKEKNKEVKKEAKREKKRAERKLKKKKERDDRRKRGELVSE